jgi:hypothetical protein
MKTNYFEILSVIFIVIISIITFYVLKLIFKKDNLAKDLAKDLAKAKAERAAWTPPPPMSTPAPEVCNPIINNFNLIKSWKGKEMIPSANSDDKSDWKFFVGVDPTHGHIIYDAWDYLLKAYGDSLRIDVDPIPTGNGRRSIRLITKDTFTTNYSSLLFIIDAEHIPEGLSVWPAFWMANLPSDLTLNKYQIRAWACGGEIDIIEGCNSIEGDADSNINLSSLHTNYVHDKPDCIQPGVYGINNVRCDSSSSDLYTCGCNGNERCPNLGCGQKAGLFGNAFNKNGGGVYACKLDSDGTVTIWSFLRNTIPNDILCDKPTPDNWTTQHSFVTFDACPGHFKDLTLVLNTTICGEWAGNSFKSVTDSITTTTSERLLACEAFSVDRKNFYNDAYWYINYVKVFEKAN